jgi:hypothetical protein
MLGSKVIRFMPHRLARADAVIAEIASVMRGANPNFRYQCPSADLDALLAGIVPSEFRLFVDDPGPKSGPQPDSHFITDYNADVFREVVVAEVYQAVPLPGPDGLRFSDYTMICPSNTGIVPITRITN